MSPRTNGTNGTNGTARTNGTRKVKGAQENTMTNANTNATAENTNGATENGASTAESEQARREAIRIQNLSVVATQLGVGEARVRYLVTHDLLKYTVKELPEFGISINVVTPEQVKEYQDAVKAGTIGSGRTQHEGTPYKVWIKESDTERVLALLKENGIDCEQVKTRTKKDSDDDSADDNAPSMENVEQEQARRDAVTSAI